MVWFVQSSSLCSLYRYQFAEDGVDLHPSCPLYVEGEIPLWHRVRAWSKQRRWGRWPTSTKGSSKETASSSWWCSVPISSPSANCCIYHDRYISWSPWSPRWLPSIISHLIMWSHHPVAFFRHNLIVPLLLAGMPVGTNTDEGASIGASPDGSRLPGVEKAALSDRGYAGRDCPCCCWYPHGVHALQPAYCG